MSDSARLVKRNGRDSKGRFVKGCKGGPGGNPLQHRVLKMKGAVLEAATQAQVKRIIKKLGSMAEDGDVAAAKVYLLYVVGKPQHGYDPRQGQPEQKQRAGYEPTPAECRVLAQELIDRADAAEGVIEADGEEVSGG